LHVRHAFAASARHRNEGEAPEIEAEENAARRAQRRVRASELRGRKTAPHARPGHVPVERHEKEGCYRRPTSYAWWFMRCHPAHAHSTGGGEVGVGGAGG